VKVQAVERMVKFEVLGQEYPLYTNAPEEDIEEILHLVKMQIENSSKSSKSILPANKAAVLTSLNMASKYVRLKRDFEQYKEQMSEVVARLTTEIENTLPPGKEKLTGRSKTAGVESDSRLARND
jgi:cell division protein ZapA (FtsZ GTPase activity inhibitor)